jgi:hypothetical protein
LHWSLAAEWFKRFENRRLRLLHPINGPAQNEFVDCISLSKSSVLWTGSGIPCLVPISDARHTVPRDAPVLRRVRTGPNDVSFHLTYYGGLLRAIPKHVAGPRGDVDQHERVSHAPQKTMPTIKVNDVSDCRIAIVQEGQNPMLYRMCASAFDAIIRSKVTENC